MEGAYLQSDTISSDAFDHSHLDAEPILPGERILDLLLETPGLSC